MTTTRTITLRLRVSPREDSIIRRDADEAGQTLGQYMRSRLIRNIRPTDQQAEAIKDLSDPRGTYLLSPDVEPDALWLEIPSLGSSHQLPVEMLYDYRTDLAAVQAHPSAANIAALDQALSCCCG